MPAQAPASKQVQVTFTGGVNPMVPAHLVAENEVQTATNVDFSMVQGALVPRRGCILNTNVGSNPITTIYNNYTSDPTIGNGNQYIIASSTTTSTVYRRILASTIPGSPVAIATCPNPSNVSISSYKQYALIAGGSVNVKDDGSATTDWVKQVPAAPVITVNTLAPISLAYAGWHVSLGTAVATSSTTATLVPDATTLNMVAITTFTGTPVNLTTNGTNSISNSAGVMFMNMAFSDPTVIQLLAIDFSIGDATFTNYYNNTVFVGTDGNVTTTIPSPDDIVDNSLAQTSDPITNQQRQDIISQFSSFNNNPNAVVINLSVAQSPWAIPASNFNFIGPGNFTNPWSQVYAMRLSVNCSGTTTITAANPALYGADNYCLTDTTNGYYWWQTAATLDASGNKIDESASSVPAGPYTMQNANVTVVNTWTATGGTHGINAIITYRLGGLTSDAYAINTHTYTGTTTFTDTMNDITALSSDFPMARGLMAASQFPGNVTSISEPYADRIFFADENLIRWTLPGQIGSIPLESFTQVGQVGDDIQGIFSWTPGLVIINRNSIYEMYGTDFEAGNYTLTRIGSRRGSMAKNTLIRTPYGIPLLNPDSLTMYVPGYSVEQHIKWFDAKYEDMFKGNAVTDPAYWKGQRIPAVNTAWVINSVATYQNNKLYLGIPTGSSTVPNTVFVLDFILQQCYWYTYAFNITSLFSDPRSIRLWAGTDTGAIMQLEYSTSDQNSTGASIPIVWTARTRAWTADTTTVLEDLSVETEGTNIQIKGWYDNMSNPQVSVTTNSIRAWNVPPLNGTFINNVAFDIAGTSYNTTIAGTLNAVYGFNFSLLSEPNGVRFWRTEYDEKNWQADKLWDVAYYDITIPSGVSVAAVTFVDNTAVMTNTLTGAGSRTVIESAFPAEIYGRIAYTTYTLLGS